jgi:hypothetical protein
MQENASYSEKDHMALIEGAQKEAEVKTAAATGGVSNRFQVRPSFAANADPLAV